MKLVAQNHSALAYCQHFMPQNEAERMREVIADVNSNWVPGERLSRDQARVMIDINSALRRVYDLSPARSAGMKPFEGEFAPLLGWDWYFNQHLSDRKK